MKQKTTKHLLEISLTMTAICMFSLQAVCAAEIAPPPNRPYKAYDRNNLEVGWSVLPVRSQEEFEINAVGGGAHQIMHAMTRCDSHPEIVYAVQDVAGPWRSIDGGHSWTKPKAEGLIAYYGQSIAVDPVNPARVLVSTYHPWDGGLPEGKGMNDHAGIYLSEDYGESWQLVLRKPDFGFNFSIHRGNNENIAFAPSSIDENGAAIWYAVFNSGKGFYKSTNYGNDWQLVNPLDEHDQNTVYEIEVHPTDPAKVYLACGEGLFESNNGGQSFTKNTLLPNDINPVDPNLNIDLYRDNFPFQNGVTSIEIDPRPPHPMWVTRLLKYDTNDNAAYISLRHLGLGLYKRQTEGGSFEKVIYNNRDGGDEQANRVFLSKAFPDRLFVTTPARYYMTTNNGVTWTRVSQTGRKAPGLNRYPYARISGLSADILPSMLEANDVIMNGDATFYTSTDGGLNPHEANSFFTGIAWGNWASSMAFNPNNPEQFAFFACDVGMNITSTGGDWFERKMPVSEVFAKYNVNTSYQGQTSGTFDIVPGSMRMISTIGQYSKSWLVKTDDQGEDWDMYDVFSSSTHDPHRLLAWHPTNPDIIFSTNKISRDGGETFVPLPQVRRYPQYSTMDSIGIYGFSYHHPETVYAVAHNRIYRSDDTAADGSWRMYLDLPIYGVDISPIDRNIVFAVDPYNPEIIYFLGKNGDVGIYDGENLTLEAGVINLATPAIDGNTVLSIATDPKNEGVIYAATAFPGTSCMFRSKDFGKTWEDITGVMPWSGMLSSQMIVNPHTGQLFRGGPFGTWIYTPESSQTTRAFPWALFSPAMQRNSQNIR